MSQCGQQRLEMERRHREALRLARVRREAMGLLHTTEELIRGVQGAREQALVRVELAAQMKAVLALSAELPSDADVLMQQVSALHEEVRGTLALADTRAAAWSEERRALVRRVEGLRGQADELLKEAIGTPEALADAEALRSALERFRGEAAERPALDNAERRMEAIRKTLDRAQERREMVQALRTVLVGRGFRVSERTLEGHVVLEGRMAGGQRAAFALRLDGSVDYKLDRYEGAACEADLAEIERAMEEHCGARFHPVQVTWRAPRGPAGAARRREPARETRGGGRR